MDDSRILQHLDAGYDFKDWLLNDIASFILIFNNISADKSRRN